MLPGVVYICAHSCIEREAHDLCTRGEKSSQATRYNFAAAWLPHLYFWEEHSHTRLRLLRTLIEKRRELPLAVSLHQSVRL
jgi:hypothetical protein